MTARLLTILGPKGGVGKSTIASNMLVAARLDGLDAVGLDLDHQASFLSWAETRAASGREPVATVVPGRAATWRQTMPAAEIVVADTPPGLEAEETVAGLLDLARASRVVLIPSLTDEPTLIKLASLGTALREADVPVAFVLNTVRPGNLDLAGARATLAGAAELCPVEVPYRAHVPRAMGAGLAVVEEPRWGGAPETHALWRFVAERLLAS